MEHKRGAEGIDGDAVTTLTAASSAEGDGAERKDNEGPMGSPVTVVGCGNVPQSHEDKALDIGGRGAAKDEDSLTPPPTVAGGHDASVVPAAGVARPSFLAFKSCRDMTKRPRGMRRRDRTNLINFLRRFDEVVTSVLLTAVPPPLAASSNFFFFANAATFFRAALAAAVRRASLRSFSFLYSFSPFFLKVFIESLSSLSCCVDTLPM